VKSVLDLLVSLCLVQSTAIPPTASLDKNLRALVETPQSSLKKLELLDTEAAATLHRYLTGYATLRRFYDLRDEEVNAQGGEKPRGASQRKKEAAKALIAVINSAADNIHGGLYDETRDSVVHVDGLLALLGEATVFVNRKFPPPLSFPQPTTSNDPSHHPSSNSCNTLTLPIRHPPPPNPHPKPLPPHRPRIPPNRLPVLNLHPMRRLPRLHPLRLQFPTPLTRSPQQNHLLADS